MRWIAALLLLAACANPLPQPKTQVIVPRPDPRRTSAAYSIDHLIRQRMQLYDQYFNDDLGPGGWANINAAHYALIGQALDAHRGRRILITFGAWHKHWFLDKLLARSDIELVDPQPFFDQEP